MDGAGRAFGRDSFVAVTTKDLARARRLWVDAVARP
jgi:hypothetical protein